MERDIQKDLELCEKACPAPWNPDHLPGVEKDCEMCQINSRSNGNADRKFIAESREALPYYIKRCQEAEELLSECKNVLEFVQNHNYTEWEFAGTMPKIKQFLEGVNS